MTEPINLEGLPRLLVDQVLNRTEDISQDLLASFEALRASRDEWRKKLHDKGLVRRDSDLPYIPIPSCCGVDGSFGVERLLAIDLVVAGAVIVEGLTPPTEKRFWPEPDHLVYVESEAHNPDTGSILRAIMLGQELLLARKAPHDIVFLDGSLTTPVIYFNQSLNKATEFSNLKSSRHLLENILKFFRAYSDILGAIRSDHQWVAVPKYTTKREVGKELKSPPSFDDRSLLSSILEPGEYTIPLPIEWPNQPWHINTEGVKADEQQEINKVKEECISRLKGIHTLYYRPHKYLPALRLEMSRAIAKTEARLNQVLKVVQYQCGMPGIMEPYPLYLADRTVKHLAQSLPVFRQITSQNLSVEYTGDIDDVFLGLHSYGTETGR